MYLNLWSYKAVRHRYSNPMIQPELEGSTQGYPLVSVEVLSHGPSDAKRNPPLPLKVSQQNLVSFLIKITRISIDFLTPKQYYHGEQYYYPKLMNHIRDIKEILKRYWEILPKEILGDTTQTDIKEILGDTTQRDIKEILGDTTQIDIKEILGDTIQIDIKEILGDTTQIDIKKILGDITQRDIKEILGDTTQRDIKEILGDTTQRDIGRYYPKRHWEILHKEILGDITQRDI
ncbi:hypothetical protein Tco_0706821 [Tanacetum coccineum]|uniref:Uncharacterized protein n=1 Tax=Tanacetum coccineum TaxID=301880 RepID=A0ABQ4Y8J1_9ASTR